MATSGSAALEGYRDIWKRKPALRVVYDDLYDRLAAACRTGVTIETAAVSATSRKDWMT